MDSIEPGESWMILLIVWVLRSGASSPKSLRIMSTVSAVMASIHGPPPCLWMVASFVSKRSGLTPNRRTPANGSTAVVCLESGRPLVGFELSLGWFVQLSSSQKALLHLLQSIL